MSSDVESRFAHLLQPIRALADNWNIDIARELEDYLGELEKISFSFDGETSSLNFAEAALVIQGSAVVYSKKVEYLYALLYQTLDYLAEKKRKKSQESGGQAGDDNEDGDSEIAFLSLDDELEEGKGIDLVDGDDKTPTRPTRVHRISLMPIVEPETNTDPTNPNVNNPKNGGRRSGFGLSNFVIDSTGALIHSATLNATLVSVGGSDVDMNQTLPDLNLSLRPNLNMTQESIRVDTSMAPDLPNRTAAMSDDEDGGEDDDDDEARPTIFGQSFAKDQANPVDKPTEGRQTRSATAAAGEKPRDKRPKKRIVDMWAMLDPHMEVGAIKNFKKGKPYRIRQTKKPESEDTDAVVPILSMADTPLTFRGVRGPDFQEFSYIYAAELKLRKETKKRERLAFSFEDTVYVGQEQEEEESHEVPEFSHITQFNGANVEAESEQSGAAELNNDFENDDDFDNDVGDLGSMQDDVPETQSYEDFYAARVEQFIAETTQYALETNLTQRVNDWKAKLAPVLEEQESHKNFDIQEYGDTLIHTLRDEYEGAKGVTITEAGDVEADEDLIVPFAKLTVNVERFEVARRFAAMLQLVNNQNVSVVSNHDLDSLSFHLRSVKPKFDIEHYLAPSLNPSAPAPSASSESKQPAKKSKDTEKTSAKGKRGKPQKEKDDSKKAKAGKKAATEEMEKENMPANRESRSKRKERVVYHEAEEEEEPEEVLRGPRAKRATEVAV